MKRYAPGTIDAPRGSVVARMFEDPRGEWVRFDDVALLEKQEALANHHNASCSMLAQRCNVLEKERDDAIKELRAAEMRLRQFSESMAISRLEASRKALTTALQSAQQSICAEWCYGGPDEHKGCRDLKEVLERHGAP